MATSTLPTVFLPFAEFQALTHHTTTNPQALAQITKPTITPITPDPYPKNANGDVNPFQTLPSDAPQLWALRTDEGPGTMFATAKTTGVKTTTGVMGASGFLVPSRTTRTETRREGTTVSDPASSRTPEPSSASPSPSHHTSLHPHESSPLPSPASPSPSPKTLGIALGTSLATLLLLSLLLLLLYRRRRTPRPKKPPQIRAFSKLSIDSTSTSIPRTPLPASPAPGSLFPRLSTPTRQELQTPYIEIDLDLEGADTGAEIAKIPPHSYPLFRRSDPEARLPPLRFTGSAISLRSFSESQKLLAVPAPSMSAPVSPTGAAAFFPDVSLGSTLSTQRTSLSTSVYSFLPAPTAERERRVVSDPYAHAHALWTPNRNSSIRNSGSVTVRYPSSVLPGEEAAGRRSVHGELAGRRSSASTSSASSSVLNYCAFEEEELRGPLSSMPSRRKLRSSSFLFDDSDSAGSATKLSFRRDTLGDTTEFGRSPKRCTPPARLSVTRLRGSGRREEPDSPTLPTSLSCFSMEDMAAAINTIGTPRRRRLEFSVAEDCAGSGFEFEFPELSIISLYDKDGEREGV